jgi:cytosine/adenosine deaminase-related metal-dependent hydrolase
LKYITAEKIHDGKGWLPADSVLEITAKGTINDILSIENLPSEKIEKRDGIICPGFVNVHCHLELSHLKNKVEEGTGLVPFLQTVTGFRNHFSRQEKEEALGEAIREIKQNGIVAIGDIANGTDTLRARETAGFHIHTFIEALGFTRDFAAARFAFSETIYRAFSEKTGSQEAYILRQSIVPHAPYSISEKMFSLINSFDKKSIISIHNQESRAENELYQTKTGDFIAFHKALSIDNSFFDATALTSLQTYLPWLAISHPLLLIHNTFMTEEDIAVLKRDSRNVFLGLCPQANWYIERQLPPVDLFQKSGLPICLGTDSLASNQELSIFAEMHCLMDHFPNLEWEELIRWATWNGALALQMEDRIGSIEAGKKPGLIQLYGEDFKEMEVLF